MLSRQIHIPNVKSISQDRRGKSGKRNLCKGQYLGNSIKSTLNMAKFKLDLYYVKTNSYMKFQVNMSKDDKEKSGNEILAKGNKSC